MENKEVFSFDEARDAEDLLQEYKHSASVVVDSGTVAVSHPNPSHSIQRAAQSFHLVSPADDVDLAHSSYSSSSTATDSPATTSSGGRWTDISPSSGGGSTSPRSPNSPESAVGGHRSPNEERSPRSSPDFSPPSPPHHHHHHVTPVSQQDHGESTHSTQGFQMSSHMDAMSSGPPMIPSFDTSSSATSSGASASLLSGASPTTTPSATSSSPATLSGSSSSGAAPTKLELATLQHEKQMKKVVHIREELRQVLHEVDSKKRELDALMVQRKRLEDELMLALPRLEETRKRMIVYQCGKGHTLSGGMSAPSTTTWKSTYNDASGDSSRHRSQSSEKTRSDGKHTKDQTPSPTTSGAEDHRPSKQPSLKSRTAFNKAHTLRKELHKKASGPIKHRRTGSRGAMDEEELAPPGQPPRSIGRALCITPYTARFEDELSIQPGDEIDIVEKPEYSAQWWRGRAHGTVGFFPIKCVTIMPQSGLT